MEEVTHNEVIRTQLQERARLTNRMKQLKLEEMNAAQYKAC